MELRHLRYFVAVAEEGHITRAAARLGIAQPPLSQQIRALEADLGAKLFTRLPRGVALTAAGEAFLREAQPVLAGAERARRRAVDAARGAEGAIAIGVTTSAVLHPLIGGILRRFSQRYPGVVLTIREANAAELTEALERRTIAVAFLRAPVARPPGIVFRELASEPLMVVLPAFHPLARPHPGGIALAALRHERFVLTRRPDAPGMYQDVLQACRAAGFEPEVAAEVGRMLTNISLVAAGVGVSLVPASMRSIRLPGVRYRRLAGTDGPRAPLTVASADGAAEPVAANLLALAGSPHRRPRPALPASRTADPALPASRVAGVALATPGATA
ncbi:MAG TPA: LysR family transcriptional regulator [Acetobacteraceae bacterium]|nr:LysR family transcriptional regulator [Acetobacteraceae bacterium]